MTNINPLNAKNQVFGNSPAMFAATLQRFHYLHDIQRSSNQAWVLLHEGELVLKAFLQFFIAVKKILQQLADWN